MKHIVFCKEHYTPLGIIRSLGESNIQPYVIILKDYPQLASKSKYIKELYVVDSIPEGYQLLIEKFGADEQDILYTGDDEITAYLDSHYNELKKRFIFFNAGQQGRINYFMDKININLLAEECGLTIPKSIVVDNGEIPDNLEFPIMTKAMSPNSGGWKDDVYICHNPEELKEAFPKIKSEKVILQQYISKDNELCLDGFSYNQGKDMFVAIASTYDYLLEHSFSSLMTVTNCEQVPEYEALEAGLRKMFAKIGFEGIFSVEFLICKEKYYFLEINFRFSSWGYASTVAGMNLPILWEKAMTEAGFRPESFARDIPEGFHAMDESPDFKYRVIGKKISLFQWLKERKDCNCLYVKNIKDKRPYYINLLQRVCLKTRKIFSKEN